MIFKIAGLAAMTILVLRQAFKVYKSGTSNDENEFVYLLLPFVSMWLMAMEVI